MPDMQKPVDTQQQNQSKQLIEGIHKASPGTGFQLLQQTCSCLITTVLPRVCAYGFLKQNARFVFWLTPKVCACLPPISWRVLSLMVIDKSAPGKLFYWSPWILLPENYCSSAVWLFLRQSDTHFQSRARQHPLHKARLSKESADLCVGGCYDL